MYEMGFSIAVLILVIINLSFSLLDSIQILVAGTMVKWAVESFLTNQDLVREMFSLLHRQYDGVGEVRIVLSNRRYQLCISLFEICRTVLLICQTDGISCVYRYLRSVVW